MLALVIGIAAKQNAEITVYPKHGSAETFLVKHGQVFTLKWHSQSHTYYWKPILDSEPPTKKTFTEMLIEGELPEED